MTVDRFGNPRAPNLPYGAEDKIRAEGRIHQGNLGPLGSASAALQENEDANPGTGASKKAGPRVRIRLSPARVMPQQCWGEVAPRVCCAPRTKRDKCPLLSWWTLRISLGWPSVDSGRRR